MGDVIDLDSGRKKPCARSNPDKEDVTATDAFEEAKKKNEENERRMEVERQKHNKKVKQSYRIPDNGQ